MTKAAQTAKTTTFEAVLGILSMGPMTGYEIRHRINLSIGNFWSESFGQIYPALNKLHQQGLVEAAETGKRGRKVYSLTPSGRRRLKAWLKVMPQPPRHRNELLLKVFFGGQSDVPVVRAQVLETRARLAADLTRYVALESEIPQRSGNSPGLAYYMIALNYGLIEARALIKWADQTLATLDQIASSNPQQLKSGKPREKP